MFSSKHRQDREREVAQCPVCNAILGQRDNTAIYKAHCAECRATFYWKPWAKKPSVIMDSYKPHKGYCGPQGCVCRD